MSCDDTCFCGDVRDEHGGDPERPGATACAVENCDCIAFEHDTEFDDDFRGTPDGPKETTDE